MNSTINLTYDKELITRKSIAAAIGVVFFVLATALGAYVRIPVAGSPVPITLQTFFVLLSGAVLGRKLGTISQAAYLALGAIGLPVFQGASFGLSYLLGPTGGYLIGFVAAAYVTGRILDSANTSMTRAIISFAAGSLIIYAFGMLWLISLYGMSATHAALAGALPFVPGDMAKVLVAAVIYSRISPRAKKIFHS